MKAKNYTALYYYRDTNGQLQSRFMDFEAQSMASAKRAAKNNCLPNERLVYVQEAE
jgi:hypothetical protein